jgi:nucleotide-binding universal stress UspA family protein
MPESRRRVVVGVSDSVPNLAALRVAMDLARSLEGVLVAVHAWAPVGGEFNYRRQPWPEMLQVWHRTAVDSLRGAFEDCFGGQPSDVPVQRLVLRAGAGRALVMVAEHPEDLLVIGTGRRGRRRLFQAGVNAYCLRHANCPVLCVPPPELAVQLRDRHRLSRP